MIPKARDPRMDRPKREESQADVYLRIGDAAEPVEVVGPDEVPETPVRLPSAVLLALWVATLAVLAMAWPRASAYDEVFEENLALKTELRALDDRMSEIEALTLRLKLYDAKLRSLTQASGDHGPLPDDTLQGAELDPEDGAVEAPDEEGAQVEVVASEPEPEPEPATFAAPRERRPAAAWAADVAARMTEVVSFFELGESDLDRLMVEVEGMRAVRDALPGIWPADGRLTSGYGWRRDPVRGTTKFHAGVDIASGRGTAIYAVAPGVVARAGTQSGYGRVVEIDHGFGVTTKYAHCTTLRVREGEEVDRGDYIATMGSTGKSTGPHVHFELRVDGNAIDPLKYLPR